MTSTATIKTNNPKESKEKRNRQKLLAGPGSEFSLSNPEELEMDYYDYNVTNAGSVPGSYLGMDPAFLVWIPPIDEGDIIGEMDDEQTKVELTDDEDEPYYEEILPRHDIDPGSNQETPDGEIPELPLKSPLLRKYSSEPEKDIISAASLLKNNESNVTSSGALSNKKTENIQMQDISHRKDVFKISSPKPSITRNLQIKESNYEKETSVVKSPSDNKIADYYELSDIQFVDDD